MRFFHRLSARLKKVRGNVDGLMSGHLIGWAYSSDRTQTDVSVGVYVNGALLAQVSANIFRGDLCAAGIGDGRHGFSIPITQLLINLADANGGCVEICVMRQSPIRIGTWILEKGQQTLGPVPAISRNSTALKKLVYFGLYQLKDALDRGPKTSAQPSALSENHSKLFGTKGDLEPDADLPFPMFAYAEFIRVKEQLDEKFKTTIEPDDIEPFFKHYISYYGAERGGLRIPLSRDAINYLNAPSLNNGMPAFFTHALSVFFDEAPQDVKAGDPEWTDQILFWWAERAVKAIHCEDCLVTDDMIGRLSRPATVYEGKRWAPSEFMTHLARNIPALSTLDLDTNAGRLSLGCATLLLAMSRPDYLRYVPPSLLDDLLDAAQDESQLQKFCRAAGLDITGLDKPRFADAMRHLNFDLDRMSFTTFTAEGHRLEQIGLPPLSQSDDPIDVQIIGPFQKTSGLGQATRLSAGMLEHSNYTTGKVDFGLNNPSPEPHSGSETTTGYRRAKVNLLHLNAETIPLAFAYQPDVFTDAYNIGYVFWELDSPSACHYLGMDLLDEIWVSSRFGVQVFQPHTDVPVTNVGMSFQNVPDIDRSQARAFLQSLANIRETDFAFIVTFDSYSFLQRKNPIGVLHAFETAFPGAEPENKNVRLIIKTQNRTNIADEVQVDLWQQIDALVAADTRIVLIDETLPYEDLLRLKSGADAYLSLHRAEGWGFGLIEAMNLHLPVICTQYSGNEDFCREDTCWPVQYDLKNLGPRDYIFVREGQKWAEPDIADAARQMRAVRNNPDEADRRAKAAKAFVQDKFGQAATSDRYCQRLDAIFKDMEKKQTRFP